MSFFNLFSSNTPEDTKSFISKIRNIFSQNKDFSEYIELLNDVLLESDVGLETTDKIIYNLKSYSFESKDDVKAKLVYILNNILLPRQVELDLNVSSKPFVLLVCGVNGVGKTTTVAKIANLYKKLGKNVCVIAGDTYRAAAIEQLSFLCDRNCIPIMKHHYGADSSAVIYDSFLSAKKKEFDLLVIDTSGRLHTNNYLMRDLLKIKTILKKIDSFAPHEILIVLDSNVGQNAVNQLSEFNKFINVSGICFTKFDSSAKGGVIFNLASSFDKPIRYVCFGENINDIDFFDSKKFLAKLF